MGNSKSYQSITIYKDMAPQILELEKVEAGEVFQAIMRYSCYGEDTDMSQYDRFVRSLWKTIKLKLDAGETHSKEISATNSSNAKKRWEKEKGNATECDRIQSDNLNATECNRITITDTVTGTNSFTSTISSTVTKTDTDQACAVSVSADRPAGAAAAEGAAPQSGDLFSVKQLLAIAEKNKVNLTDEGVHAFHEEMQESGWILYDRPVEKKGIVKALRGWAKYHLEYSLDQVEPERPEAAEKKSSESDTKRIDDSICKKVKKYMSAKDVIKYSTPEAWRAHIPDYCPKDIFTDEELVYLSLYFNAEWDLPFE